MSSSSSSLEAARIVPSSSQSDLQAATDRGGPRCISDVSKDECLLSVDENFVVVAKPHDVRMDGEFDITLQKLLLSWVPISTLSTLKWVHQLDYATSGVLCVARHKKAAAMAQLAFTDRETTKQYLAVVEGHIDVNKWSIRSDGKTWSEEGEYFSAVTKKHKAEKDQINLPGTWQEESLRKSLDVYYEALQNEIKKEDTKVMTSEDADIKELSSKTYDEFIKNSKLRKLLRRTLTKRGFTDISKEERANENILKISEIQQKKDTDIVSAPQEFHSKAFTDNPHAVFRVDLEPELLYIDVPIAEVPGDFRMEVGNEGNPGKSSQTRLRVLSHGTFHGRPITKVLLLPHSGRRHQLRIHTRAIGHPIVGDCTYGTVAPDCKERMMLHAYKLQVRVPSGAMSKRQSTGAGAGEKGEEELEKKWSVLNLRQDQTILVQGEAPDPYQTSEFIYL